MKQPSRCSDGFGVTGILLLVIMLVTIGFIGWLVYYSKNKSPNSVNVSTNTHKINSKNSSSSQIPKDESLSWTQVTSKLGGFTIRIPDGWHATNFSGEDFITGYNINDISYQKGAPVVVDVTETPYAGDSTFRFSAVQLKNTDNSSWLDGHEQQRVPFSVGNAEGYRYYEKYPSDISGCCIYPDSEIYTYEFKTALSTTYVRYIVINYNQATATSFKLSESDKNQVDFIDKVVKTLVINK